MRHLPAAAVSAVLAVAFVSSAEARGGRFGGGVFRSSGSHVQHMRPAPGGTRTGNWTAVGIVTPYKAGRPTSGSSSSEARLPTDGGGSSGARGGEAPALTASTPAEWCPAKTVAGSGAGFCLVN